MFDEHLRQATGHCQKQRADQLVLLDAVRVLLPLGRLLLQNLKHEDALVALQYHICTSVGHGYR